ncbi:MAG: glycosyltransferase family 39 protein [Planctomycetota bacterium]
MSLESPSSRTHVAVFWAFVAALGVRLGIAILAPVINSDGPLYLTQAETLLRGDFSRALFDHNYAPATGALISVALFLGLPPELAGRLVCVLAGALAVFPLHALARRAFSAPVAAAGVFLYAFAPVPAHLSAAVLTTGPFLFVSLLALGLSAQLRETPRAWTALLAGTAVAIAYATRADGLVLLPFAVAAGLFARGRGRGARVLLALLAVAPAVAAAAIYVRMGGASITHKLDATEWERFLALALPSRYVLGLMWEDLGEAIFLPLVPFAVLGLAARAKGGDRVLRIACLVLVAVWAVVLMRYAWATGAMSKRYTTPLAVLLLPWAAAGLMHAAEWCAARMAVGARGKAWACALAVWIACVACVPKLLRTHDGDRLVEKAAGLFLKDQPGPRSAVLCGSTCVPFYSGLPPAPIVLATYPPDRAFSELRRRGVTYVVKDRGLEALAPEFVKALQAPRVTPLGRITVSGSDDVLEVFRLTGRPPRKPHGPQAVPGDGR